MCYSAQIWSDYRKFQRYFDATISIREFHELYWRRAKDPKLKIPKAMDAAFATPTTEAEREIRAAIEEYERQSASRLEQELFKQKKRLADAERTLQGKPTKAAQESRRIAGDKIAWALGKLSDLRRTELTGEDARIFPGWYAPVLLIEDGHWRIKPMRYQCRPAGKPAFYDSKYPGTYNARRDNLGGFWKEQFGRTHCLAIVDAFYENVTLHGSEGRELRPGETEKNVVLEFRPDTSQPIFVACLYSRWTDGEDELLSFAAITDEPPPEIRAAGHDRCVIPLKRQNVQAWLTPDPSRLAELQAILDDRETPYYEHRLAA